MFENIFETIFDNVLEYIFKSVFKMFYKYFRNYFRKHVRTYFEIVYKLFSKICSKIIRKRLNHMKQKIQVTLFNQTTIFKNNLINNLIKNLKKKKIKIHTHYLQKKLNTKKISKEKVFSQSFEQKKIGEERKEIGTGKKC